MNSTAKTCGTYANPATWCLASICLLLSIDGIILEDATSLGGFLRGVTMTTLSGGRGATDPLPAACANLSELTQGKWTYNVSTLLPTDLPDTVAEVVGDVWAPLSCTLPPPRKLGAALCSRFAEQGLREIWFAGDSLAANLQLSLRTIMLNITDKHISRAECWRGRHTFYDSNSECHRGLACEGNLTVRWLDLARISMREDRMKTFFETLLREGRESEDAGPDALVLYFGTWHMRTAEESAHPEAVGAMLSELLSELEHFRTVGAFSDAATEWATPGVGVPVSSNLARILRLLVILNIPRPFDDLKGTYANLQGIANVTRLNDVTRAVAAAHGVPMLDVFAMTHDSSPLHFTDGTHPSDAVDVAVLSVLLSHLINV
jgi:hypothetical protein